MLTGSTQHLVHPVKKFSQPSTDMPRSPFISAVQYFMTYAEGDCEIESSNSMAANCTFGHTRNLCVNLAHKNCVLAMKQADFAECP